MVQVKTEIDWKYDKIAIIFLLWYYNLDNVAISRISNINNWQEIMWLNQ